jgi:tRNA(Arg) A34 adenosine deaminase TadA
MAESDRRRDEVVLRLPQWLRETAIEKERRFDTAEAKMQFVIALARRNIEHETGGPFGAAVFEADTGRLIAPGVNLVEPLNCSIAHAEMVAVAMAQQAVGSYDLGAGNMICELVTSTEPCAMCLGAIPWSGVRRVLCGARGEDACAIGFDEGAKPSDWVGTLQCRGIEVVRDLCRDEARAVLQHYLACGGRIYNARGQR